ncbi:DUF2637 domain-containing protein [Nocardia macrotermitis]|uniref:DUF2637 domain-containing protein n=1 Tax=Nocardia macrotermitis TaxID=2585198 RepID=A0A7K0DB85_9NOCA|nr:DUF2637 domain-containing protein [Nocardia macrotermitis]MQY23055.1 hypothetical protein [Nocardia macrotermitis]
MSTDIRTTSAVPTASADHSGPRAHVFFWSVLAAAALVSITGNATYAVLHAPAVPLVVAAVAVVPPIALLAAVHGVTILLRAHAQARLTHLIATLMTVLIAGGAFWLSFTALRALAVQAGIPTHEAWLWPLIIEGSMAQSTVALLALARSPRFELHTRLAVVEEATPATQNSNDATAEDDDDHHEPEQHPTINATPKPADKPATHPWPEIAAAICNRDPSHRRDPAEVTTILTRHYNDGRTPTQISRELNRSRSTVSRIISHATEFVPAR